LRCWFKACWLPKDENRFHRTSVAQVFAFVLSALAVEAPGQSWHDAAAVLDTWAVEYIDILKKIPETVRKAPPHSPYKPGRWKGFVRSPIRTRARRLAAACNTYNGDHVDDYGDESDDNDTPPTPAPNRTTRQRVGQGNSTAPQLGGARNRPNKSIVSDQDEMEGPRIEDRPYCTQQCLLGLTYGGPIDDQCPNLQDHKKKYLRQSTFLRLIRIQLAKDRGRDADCKPLYIKGSRRALFKIRLYSHGYTLVAKWMEELDRDHLLQERTVYSQLCEVQGSYIPVCLGTVDLALPYYYDFGIYVSMLFLSWAGRPVSQYLNPENEGHILQKATAALQALHHLRFLHKDAELRNMLWDDQHGSLMLVDLERAEIRARQPLSAISPNRKRNRQGKMKLEDDFDREMRSAKGCISRCIRLSQWPKRT
jgi:tRNA A-37 threonylcarbamoyl transferase component Bud32